MCKNGIQYIKPEDPVIKGKTLRSILLDKDKDGIYRCTNKHRNDVVVFNTPNQGTKATFIDGDGRGFGDVMDFHYRDSILKDELDNLYIRIGSAQITVIRE